MRQTDPFLSVVDAYSAATGVPDKTVSKRVFGDSGKIPAMRAGAGITLERHANALRWLSDHWPDGAEWPPSLSRPAPTPSDAAA